MRSARVLATFAFTISLIAVPGVARSAPLPPVIEAATSAAGLPPGSSAGTARLVVDGSWHLGEQDELLKWSMTVDPDLTSPASTVPFLRKYTDADLEAGRLEPYVRNVAPSPDGLRMAFWVRDPDGFVVPGGTRPAGDGYTGDSLVVMDVDGRNRRVVYDNRPDFDNREQHLILSERMTWLDPDTLLVPGWAQRTPPASGFIGVGRTVDATTGALGVALKYDDGGQQVRNIHSVAAGGGTKVGTDYRSLVRIVHRSGAVAPIVPSDDPDVTIAHFDVSSDGDHIAFLEARRTEAGSMAYRLAVLDYAGDGEWTDRTVVADMQGWWLRWLPSGSADSSHVLVGQEAGRVVAVALGSTVPAGERVHTVVEDSNLTNREWEVQPLPEAGSGSADLVVEAGALDTDIDEPVETTLTVTNRGPDPATGVRLESGTSEGSFTSLQAPGATCTAASGTCEIGSLGVGQSLTVTVSAPPMAAGVARLRARVVGDQVDWNTGNSAFDDQIHVRVPAGQGAEKGQLIELLGSCGTSSTDPCNMRIVTVDADGTDQLVVVDGGDDETLSLVEVHKRTGLIVWSSQDRNTGVTMLNISRLDGSLVRSVPAPEGMVTGVTTPDGRTLVYLKRGNGSSEPLASLRTLRLDVEGAEPAMLVRGNDNGIPNHFRVSPDGTQLAYMVQAQGEHGANPFVIDLDGRHDRALPPPVSPTGSTIFWPRNMVWSPDGKQVALRVSYEGPYDRHHIVLVPVDGGTITDLGEGPTEPAPNNFFQLLDWSPDGTEILTSTNSRVIGVRISDREQVVYPFEWYPLWTGKPASVQEPEPEEDTTPPTGSYSSSPSSYLRPGTTLTLTRTALADDVDARDDLDVVVTWGDGAVTQGDGSAATFEHTFDSAGTPRVTVTVTDQAGNEATLFDRTFTVDGTSPVVTVKEPACGKRKPRACDTYRSSAAGWASARGAVSDAGGAGVGAVEVSAVQKRGRKWWALTDGGWEKFGKRGAAVEGAAELAATIGKKGWKRDLADPSAGKLILTVTAVDQVGNSHTAEFTRTLSD